MKQGEGQGNKEKSQGGKRDGIIRPEQGQRNILDRSDSTNAAFAVEPEIGEGENGKPQYSPPGSFPEDQPRGNASRTQLSKPRFNFGYLGFLDLKPMTLFIGQAAKSK